MQELKWLKDSPHKTLIKKPILKSGNNYITGFRTTTFRFQIHKHTLSTVKGIKPGTKIPHINYGIEGKGHYILKKLIK